MSKKVRVVIIVVFALTIGLVATALVISNKLVSQPDVSEEIEASCPESGQCEFIDCNSQKIYSENCQFEITDGFCCNNYTSPTDRCNKNAFCSGEEIDETICEDTGTVFHTCDRCSIGKSSKIRVLQGEAGCIYQAEICKPDTRCGDLPEEGGTELNLDDCADDREVGEEWKECCIGDDIGKSRTIKKEEDCSLVIVQDCTEDPECTEDDSDSTSMLPTQTQQQAVGTTTEPEATEEDEAQQVTGTSTLEPTEQATTTQDPNQTQGTTVEPAQATQAPTQELTAQPTEEPTSTMSPTTTSPVTSPTETESTPTTVPSTTTTSITSLPTDSNYPSESVTEEMENLPTTSLPFQDSTIIILSIIFTLIGILILRDEDLQIQLETLAISLRYSLNKNTTKLQKHRERKIYEKKFKNRKTQD
ncbi:hypothetical protein GF362_07150 [Candidatus Dojkabacteria bacterium]|nr:hypothetical protein [Candidatus Dojkabacteria bacterium]